jgi:predicted RNase H-like nuclease
VVVEHARFANCLVEATIEDIFEVLHDVRVLALDIPIGMPRGRDIRQSDVEARRFVGPRSSSVFHTPPREVLEAPTYREANRLSKKISARGISAQAYALRSKILEVDPIAAVDDRIVEAHPEVCFRAMKGSVLEYPKKSWNGQMERRSLLRSQGLELPDHLPKAGAVPADDLLDAAAAAWTASRVSSAQAGVLPASEIGAATSRRGLIWF